MIQYLPNKETPDMPENHNLRRKLAELKTSVDNLDRHLSFAEAVADRTNTVVYISSVDLHFTFVADTDKDVENLLLDLPQCEKQPTYLVGENIVTVYTDGEVFTIYYSQPVESIR